MITSPASNTRGCFRAFLGQRMLGLFNVLSDDSPCTTLIFEDGRGLTIARNGSYWVDDANTINRALERQRNRLEATQFEIAEFLTLAGARRHEGR